MPVYNSDVVQAFEEMADLLEIEGANQFRVRAYRNAARSVGDLSESVAEWVQEGRDLTQLPGIGKDLSAKIKEIVETGKLAALQKLRKETPSELAEMLSIPGLGPKRVEQIHEQLGVNTLNDLKQALEQGKVRRLEGFGEKTEENIRKGLKQATEREKRTLLSTAEEIAEPLIAYVRNIEGVKKAEVAGSYRRRKETVGDLDMVATGDDGSKIIDAFVGYEEVEEIVSQGETRSTVMLRRGMQVDLRVVKPESYGAAMIYFTGSKPHNLALRRMAIDRGWKNNEYGLYDDGKLIASSTEKDMYRALGLPYIEPELREDRGEIAAAQEGRLPTLVTLEDMRGDLQAHSQYSDGKNTLEEMAQAAKERGYEYLAITDHSPRVAVAQGVDAKRLAKEIDEVDALNDQLKGIRLLKSIEVDILEDGSLDMPDQALAKLDLVLCSVHSQFNLSQDKQTERIIRAMDNPNVNILAHPTGRLIGKREPYHVDMERIMQAALERGCFLEINANPARLDLNDVYSKMAKDMGLKLSISTDAHTTRELHYMRFGVGQARRGWLEAGDVLNTRSWGDLRALLKRR